MKPQVTLNDAMTWRLCWLIWLAVVWAVISAQSVCAQVDQSDEIIPDALWAMTFLVKNPAGAGPYTIGVFGNDPASIRPFQDMAQRNKKLTPDLRRLKIEHFQDLKGITKCDMLYVYDSDSLADVVKKIGGSPVVIVAAPGVDAKGVVLNIILNKVQNKIDVHVSAGAAKNAGLMINPQTHRKATIVE